jgi:hypothetical protein
VAVERSVATERYCLLPRSVGKGRNHGPVGSPASGPPDSARRQEPGCASVVGGAIPHTWETRAARTRVMQTSSKTCHGQRHTALIRHGVKDDLHRYATTAPKILGGRQIVGRRETLRSGKTARACPSSPPLYHYYRTRWRSGGRSGGGACLQAGFCGSAGSRSTERCAGTPRQPFCEPRSHCEMDPSPAVDDRDELARQTIYTACY